jgi:hypothetical protein
MVEEVVETWVLSFPKTWGSARNFYSSMHQMEICLVTWSLGFFQLLVSGYLNVSNCLATARSQAWLDLEKQTFKFPRIGK